MFDFSGKNILVTGAAGSLGKAVVKEFLNGKGTVLALDHRVGRLSDNVEILQSKESLRVFEGIDLTDRQGVLALSDKIKKEIGLVDVVVNTVGGFTSGDAVHDLSPETLQKMMDLNVTTFLNTSAGFVPHLMEKGGGKVITVGSRSGLSGGAKTGAYAAAKGALLRLTESMAQELKGENIQVNCILPSTIDTADNRQAMPNADYSKWVQPEKLARTILFLASPAADEITGVSLPVYGRS